MGPGPLKSHGASFQGVSEEWIDSVRELKATQDGQTGCVASPKETTSTSPFTCLRDVSL